MVKRRSKQEMLDEFHRLNDCFDAIRTARRSLEPEYGLVNGVDYTRTRDQMLALLADKSSTLSALVAGVREALNVMSEGLMHVVEDAPDKANEVLLKYQEMTGRDYWRDAGHPKKQIQSILRRGFIASHTEFRLVSGHISNAESQLLSEREMKKASNLMQRYEGAQKA